MKHCCALFVALFLAAPTQSVNPLSKVIQLLSDLEGKIIKDGEAEQKAYEEYVDWCGTGAKD